MTGGGDDPVRPGRWTKAVRDFEDRKAGRTPERKAQLLEVTRAARVREAERVARLLKRDRQAAKADVRRKSARVEVAEGSYVNLADTVETPTPERLARAQADDLVQKVDVKERVDNSVRVIGTVRLGATRLVQLHNRGVIDTNLLAACKWYRDTWYSAQYDGIRVGRYGQSLSREAVRDHLGSDRQREARDDFRWVRQFVPEDVRVLFDLVVLQEMTINAAAKACRCRYQNAVAAFRRGALELHGGIKDRLQIGEW